MSDTQLQMLYNIFLSSEFENIYRLLETDRRFEDIKKAQEAQDILREICLGHHH